MTGAPHLQPFAVVFHCMLVPVQQYAMYRWRVQQEKLHNKGACNTAAKQVHDNACEDCITRNMKHK